MMLSYLQGQQQPQQQQPMFIVPGSASSMATMRQPRQNYFPGSQQMELYQHAVPNMGMQQLQYVPVGQQQLYRESMPMPADPSAYMQFQARQQLLSQPKLVQANSNPAALQSYMASLPGMYNTIPFTDTGMMASTVPVRFSPFSGGAGFMAIDAQGNRPTGRPEYISHVQEQPSENELTGMFMKGTSPDDTAVHLTQPRKRQERKGDFAAVGEDLDGSDANADFNKRVKPFLQTARDHIIPNGQLQQQHHDVGLGGQDRLQVDFISLGSVPADVPVQTFGRCRLIIPSGLAGTHRMYSQAWKTEILYNTSPTKQTSKNGAGAVCLTWRVTNLFSGHVSELTETLQQATLRQESGRTISNLVMQQAMEDRAREVEVALAREVAGKSSPKGSSAANGAEDEATETAAAYNPIRQVNLRNVIRKLRPKRCGEGLLFFGLRHDIVQQTHGAQPDCTSKPPTNAETTTEGQSSTKVQVEVNTSHKSEMSSSSTAVNVDVIATGRKTETAAEPSSSTAVKVQVNTASNASNISGSPKEVEMTTATDTERDVSATNVDKFQDINGNTAPPDTNPPASGSADCFDALQKPERTGEAASPVAIVAAAVAN
jgi:hypothetical protein